MEERGEVAVCARIDAGAAQVNGVAAIILAAGASSRMGRPKALLTYHGETFLARWIRMFRVYCEDVVVVSSAPMDAAGARTVVNPEPERGMLSSLQCGVASLAGDVRAAAFTPVDLPAVSESTVADLIGGWSGELVRIPRCGGRRGHPVVVARPLFGEFLALPPTAEARAVIRRREVDIAYLDVDDPGILADVDTPADYERLK